MVRINYDINLKLETSTKTIDPEISRTIQDAQDRGEVLVSYALLVLLLAFAIAYVASPRGFSVEQSFEAVPLVLSAYAPLVVLRIVLATKRLLSDRLLFALAIVDVLLILSLIFSWHIQYQQPAAFALKAPTFTAFFTMIVLRALSYRSAFIITTGVSAIVGWVLLVAYCLLVDPDSRTRDFITYTTSNVVLLGAEIEKILALAIVTGTLAVAVHMKRKLLIEAATETYAIRSLSRFFSPEVLHRITKDGRALKPGHGELRRAAILMMDLRGFTKISATTEPSAVIKLVAEYQARMVGPILNSGGCIDKFMGDGIMAHFGAATPSSTAAADCLHAITELRRTVDAWNIERLNHGVSKLEFGIACATGDVIFGVVGDGTRLELTTIGDAVNLSAKLEKHTKAIGVAAIATETMLFEAKRQGFVPDRDFRILRNSEVVGVAHPLNIVVLTE